MKIALQEALKCLESKEVPVGAVIVNSQGDIISKSGNLIITQNNPTAHAEIIAIELACVKLQTARLDNLILYTTLEPCPMCAFAISLAKISKVYIGATDLKYGGMGGNINLCNKNYCNHVPEIYFGIMEMECENIMKEFFKTKRK